MIGLCGGRAHRITAARTVFSSSIWAYLTAWSDSAVADGVCASELSSESMSTSDDEEMDSFLARLLIMAFEGRKMRN